MTSFCMGHWTLFEHSKPTNVSCKHGNEIIKCLGDLLLNEKFWKVKNRVGLSSETLKYELFKLGTNKWDYKVYTNNISEKLEEFHTLVFEREQRMYRLGKRNEPKIKDCEFINRELTFDLHWYEECDDISFVSTKIPLVAECEWSFKRPKRHARRNISEEAVLEHSEAFYDFQKLLYSNAELRLMIFRLKDERFLEPLHDAFLKRIQTYLHLAKGSMFLFAGYSIHSDKKLFYCEVESN